MADNEMRQEMNSLKQDLAALRKDMGEMVHNLKEAGKHQAGAARDKAEAELHHRIQQLSEAYDSVRSQGHQATDSVAHKIEDRPLASVAIAFAVGMLFGKVINNGR